MTLTIHLIDRLRQSHTLHVERQPDGLVAIRHGSQTRTFATPLEAARWLRRHPEIGAGLALRASDLVADGATGEHTLEVWR